MSDTTTDLFSVTLWQSYVGRGAPSNASGQRTGYGATKKSASENAAHWNNQAPYEKFRRVSIADLSKPSEYSPDYERAVAICGGSDLYEEFASPKERAGIVRRRELIARGRYASAVLDLLRERGEAK